ncbi:MAG: hypothetical protein QM768_16370 [Agriterribacter sp.]
MVAALMHAVTDLTEQDLHLYGMMLLVHAIHRQVELLRQYVVVGVQVQLVVQLASSIAMFILPFLISIIKENKHSNLLILINIPVIFLDSYAQLFIFLRFDVQKNCRSIDRRSNLLLNSHTGDYEKIFDFNIFTFAIAFLA